MKRESKSYRCECGKKWQEWVELDGPHQTFNEWGFRDYRNPELKKCAICESKDE